MHPLTQRPWVDGDVARFGIETNTEGVRGFFVAYNGSRLPSFVPLPSLWPDDVRLLPSIGLDRVDVALNFGHQPFAYTPPRR